MRKAVFMVGLLTIQLGACATITKGKNQDVVFNSKPSKANVLVTELRGPRENILSCITPCMLELSKNALYQLEISKPGYAPFETDLTPKVKAEGGTAAVGSFIATAGIGTLVDMHTGSLYDFDPNPVNVILKPDGEKSYLSEKPLDSEDEKSSSGNRAAEE